jgi:hypothetical protein
MDPVSIIGLSVSLASLIDITTKSIRYLRDLQSRHELASMKVQVLIGQLSTLNAALDQIHKLTAQLASLTEHEKLVQSLGEALYCCKIIIVDLEGKLCACFTSQGGFETLTKMQFLRDEKSLDSHLGMMNHQVNAMNLLLTAFNWYVIVFERKLDDTKTPQPDDSWSSGYAIHGQ